VLAAAEHVYDTVYKKPYPPLPKDKRTNADWTEDFSAVHGIERPNHSLANSMRKAALVPDVVATFRASSSAPSDCDFDLSEELIAIVQIGLLFESSGRESDVSWWVDPKLHDEYDLKARALLQEYGISKEFNTALFSLVIDAMAKMYKPVNKAKKFGLRNGVQRVSR
jgi:hypothetical protein